MTLRDALVALAERLRTPLSDDECTQYTMGKRTGRHNAAEMLEAVIAAHPAVEGDAMERAFDAYCDAEPNGTVSIDAIRATLDAAWPGMVADAGRWRKVSAIATQNTAYDRYGSGGYWSVGLFSQDSHKSFAEAVDALEASRG